MRQGPLAEVRGYHWTEVALEESGRRKLDEESWEEKAERRKLEG
jgi:hypothetical protein